MQKILTIATILSFTPYQIKTETFTIGYLTGSQRGPGDLEYPKPGRTISGAISLAVEEINKGLLGEMGHKLDFIVAETYGEEMNSVQKTADLWTQNVSVYVGPQETCQHEAFMAAAFNLPMISYFCTHHATSDKKKFPTFARTRPPDTQISKSVASTLLAFNWKHVVLLYLKSPDFEFGNVAKIVLQNLHSHGINVFATKFWTTPFHHGYGENPFYKLVKETYRDTRIYVIIGHHYDHFGLMLAMENMKLFDKGEYFVLGVDLDQYDNKFPEKYLRGLLNEEKNLLAQKAYRNYIGVVPSNPVGYDNFTTLVNTYMEQPPFSYPNPLHYVGGVKKIRAEAAYLYDAVHLYSKALISALQNGTDPRNGTAIINFIKGTHYKSAMGYIVYMDENGDAEGNYTLIARKRLFHEKDEYGLFPVGVFALRSTTSKLPKLFMKSHIDWVAGKPPIAVPFCGFRGEKCITHTVEIASGVTGGIFLIFTIISLVLYRNWKYEQELDSLIWKVDFKDIQINEEPKNSSSTHLGAKATRSLHPLIRTSQVSLSSNPDADFRYSTIFTQIGIYKGRVFAVKKVNKKSIDISRDMKKELKMIRDLRHDNLNAFIGACTDPPNICIITEYCTRGSLKDILENENVKLDNMFIASLVGDILRGMIYLHDSPVRFHGALHTANCLVDSRWVVKISDFGLREFKKGSLPDHQLQNNDTSNRIKDKSYKLLYRAPELLRLDSFQKTEIVPRGTSKGDIYSFGIILYELHSRHGPFGECKLSHAEILNRVIDTNQNGHPFRPPLESLENSFDFVRDCLKECWMENPDDRPEFKCIRAKLRPLRKGMKPNIFDNMMAMMEKYANNLEVLVDERTDQLQEEKKKTEALLYEMLPRSVAEQLKRGNKVEAESFDCVTIYFSDIVGFTSMSAESTPLQVVDFLNDLYTCFDSIIENYDVYKVETIGDAYMVVSGLPIKSDNEHAAEVASMSLHLLSAVQKFTIRHRPKEKLLLRIGIHSGPVCAGVVGLKMPRYCLFGDTVNTASRMESTGTPLKIHCSKQCRDLLTQIGGYHVIERGIIEMKGKGGQKTFWLVGEDAAQKQKRNEERQKRRQNINKALSNGKIDNGNYLLTRSSLKNKNTIVRSPLQRCNSFESPKRLRFANGEHLEQTLLEVITDSPCKKSANSLIEHSLDCSEAFRTSSTSCPCIENLANSAATLAQSQLSMLTRDDRRNSKSKATAVKPSYNSVPVLFPNLSVPKHPVIHTLSAPSSPRNKPDFFDLNLAQFPECEEVMPMWTGDSMPLLKVTKPPSSESCI